MELMLQSGVLISISTAVKTSGITTRDMGECGTSARTWSLVSTYTYKRLQSPPVDGVLTRILTRLPTRCYRRYESVLAGRCRLPDRRQ